MKKKRISLKQWYEIGRYHPANKFFRHFCVHKLWYSEPEDMYYRKACLNIFAWIILLIPYAILTFFVCCWDGGLKNFELLPMDFQLYDTIYNSSPKYEIAKRFYEES